MEISEEDYLKHYGILRKSGRYPWGSGETQQERNQTFLSMVEELRTKHGLSEAQVAKSFGLTTTELRAAKSIAKNAEKLAQIDQAQRLKEHGYSNVAAAAKMGIPEPTYRTLLVPGAKDKADVLAATTGILKAAVEEKKYVDVGSGVERHMGITADKLKIAVAALKEEGYTLHYIKVLQLGTGKETSLKVLAAPDVTWSEVHKNRDHIQQVMGYSEDGGRNFDRIMPPLSVDSKRVAVRYAEQGGADADGVIYVRPGVKDISLGSSRYAQVRIAVDGTHYLKGMAMYKDDLPAGVDLMFNTNKKNTGNKLDAMKPMGEDPSNPFGALIKRQIQEPTLGGKRVTSAMNIINEEGDWENWSKSLATQLLSKQSRSLASKQLDMAYDHKLAEFSEIMALDNPAVKKRLLKTFSDSVDSSAVHLKAAALPRQGSHVILPINSMKPTEIYAPNFRDGERVVLIRYPHGGKFEIPELTVNNRHPEAKKLLGQAKDAVGIHSDVAARLSGADFDGDTVLVIPNNSNKIKTEPALEGLKNFDPQRYKVPKEFQVPEDAEGPTKGQIPRMTPKQKAQQMGAVSNLITDMTIRGATKDELARAVRHSMVVIDGEKHYLNYKQSEIDNNIKQLKVKYQGGVNRGASTIFSRAGAEVRVSDLKGRSAEEGGSIDKKTGRKVFDPTLQGYTNKDGIFVEKKRKSKQLAEEEDAHVLSSGTPIETIYADHSNRMKALANEARRVMVNTTTTPYSPEARASHAREVQSLDAKLNLALRNSPLERQAQVIANAIVRAKKDANPDMEAGDLKKIKSLALMDARNRVGAKKSHIEITPEEWAAIQAGAITTNKLTQILENADLDKIKELATPKTRLMLTNDNKSRALEMLRNGYTQAEVADHLGVSVSTLKRSITEGDV